MKLFFITYLSFLWACSPQSTISDIKQQQSTVTLDTTLCYDSLHPEIGFPHDDTTQYVGVASFAVAPIQLKQTIEQWMTQQHLSVEDPVNLPLNVSYCIYLNKQKEIQTINVRVTNAAYPFGQPNVRFAN